MQLSTFSENFYTDLEVPIYCLTNGEAISNLGVGSRYRIILIESGTGIIKINDTKMIFMAPCIFCLNEKENLELEKSQDLKAKVIYFHPNVINDALNFESINNTNVKFEGTTLNDYHTLWPFFERNDSYKGKISIGPSTTQRLVFLLNNMNSQLTLQKDLFWPCRSRSFLLEILFLVEQSYSSCNDNDKPEDFFEFSPNVDKVILYLHNNYQSKITLQELTSKFNMNRTSLSEQFLNATGSTIITYLTKLRIKIACSILVDTSVPVNEIADRVGFNDITHFGRVFRKYIGFSPKQYREMNLLKVP